MIVLNIDQLFFALSISKNFKQLRRAFFEQTNYQNVQLCLKDGLLPVYKTGTQIIASKVKTLIGGPSENSLKTISFNDEQTTDKLNELKNEQPANLIVISGELTVDLPDKIEEYNKSDTMKTFSVSSNKLTFNHCLLDQVIEVLDGQYAIGSVEVIVISPVPEV